MSGPCWDCATGPTIEPGAWILDRDGDIVEELYDRQRLRYDLTAAWDSLSWRWRIAELRSPALGTAMYTPGGTPSAAPPCPWNPLDLPPTDGFDVTVDREWCDGLGRQVPRRHLSFTPEAPRHCEWQSAALLHIGPQPGAEIDNWNHYQYARDPEGVFEDLWQAPFETLTDLPDGALATGLTNGNVRLYYIPETYDREIYAQMGDTIERWPRLMPEAGCE
jgi:hypothetical protein